MINETLTNFFRNDLIRSRHGDFWPDKVFLEFFLWVYGNTFESIRRLDLRSVEPIFALEFSVNVELIVSTLLDGIHEYIWGVQQFSVRYSSLINYFCSAYPFYNQAFFSKAIPPDSYFSIDQPITKGYYTLPRWLIASLNNIVTEYDLDEDYEPLEALRVNDPVALKELMNGMSKIKMPEEYYELERFVLSKGSDCINASE